MEQNNESQNELQNEPKLKISSNEIKKTKKQNKKMRKFFSQMKEVQANNKRKFERKIEILKQILGKEDFNALKSICTVKTEEKKDSNGNIIVKAKSEVNYTALLIEGRLAVALNRESRIKAGKRKRTSGSASNRATHSKTVKFINKRNKELTKK